MENHLVSQLHEGRTKIMGILNLTPDSFSDGGDWLAVPAAVNRALEMQQQGADIIDIGGESTRPGAAAVSVQQELDRVIPVIEALTTQLDVPVSIDTSKPEVMSAAVAAGAAMINDVCALRHEGAMAMAASLSVPVCLMHMQGEPRIMQDAPRYDDVVVEVQQFLTERAAQCEASGIKKEHIVLDPGFGFGKTLQHNISLFKALPELLASGYPLLVGVSRKSMIGQITGKDVSDRVAGSVSAALLAAMAGASILRVHDVAETCDALKVVTALSQ